MEAEARVGHRLLIRTAAILALFIEIRLERVEAEAAADGKPADVPGVVDEAPLVGDLVLERERRVVGLDLRRCQEAAAPERLDAVFRRQVLVRCRLVEIAVADSHRVVAQAGARRGQRIDAGQVHVVAAIDERRLPAAAHQARV